MEMRNVGERRWVDSLFFFNGFGVEDKERSFEGRFNSSFVGFESSRHTDNWNYLIAMVERSMEVRTIYSLNGDMKKRGDKPVTLKRMLLCTQFDVLVSTIARIGFMANVGR